MKEYRIAIEKCARLHLDNMVHNEGNEHALIIFENMFKYSKDHVRIAAKDMANVEVVNNATYISAMKTFLNNPNAQLDILLVNFNESVRDLPHETNFFYHIYNSEAYSNGRVRIKQSNGGCFKAGGKPMHFCTSDGHAYRMERDINLRTAHCNFGDKDTTKHLENLFDRVFSSNNQSTSVDLNKIFKAEAC